MMLSLSSAKLPIWVSFLLAPALGIVPATAWAGSGSCSPLPKIDRKLGFVENFNNPCYAVPMASGSGSNSSGDLNSTYQQTYYQIQPGFEFVILGVFPNTRFMSVSAYDEHLAVVGQLIDTQILPLNALQINPLLPGATYKPNQQYGITVNLGGGAPVSVAPGCSTSNSTIDQNALDVSQIHSGLTWTGYPNLPPDFPPHQTGVNDAGVLEVRKYVDLATPADAVVIVRQLSNGCALPAQQALAMNILGPLQPTPNTWVNEPQITAHKTFANTIQPRGCYPRDPRNAAVFFRTQEYVTLPNGAAAAVDAILNAGELEAVFAGTQYLRVRFRLPTTPTTPCTAGGCSFTGNEQLRYKSLSLQNDYNTILSLKDSDFVKDSNGNVALILGVGAPPFNAIPSNNYTYVDLSLYANYQSFSTFFVRDILANQSFDCSGFNVPFKTMTYNPEGGFMGAYDMSVDFVQATSIPAVPVPPNRIDSCALVPPAPESCQ